MFKGEKESVQYGYRFHTVNGLCRDTAVVFASLWTSKLMTSITWSIAPNMLYKILKCDCGQDPVNGAEQVP
jgi:hypothetical protein